MVHGHKIEHIFSTRSNEFHLEQLAPVQKFYSLQGVLSYEGLMDRAIETLAEQLDARFVHGANAGKTCDIADWLSYCEWPASDAFFFSLCHHVLSCFGWRVLTTILSRPVAWDVIGAMTWSREMGFMKSGTDVENLIYVNELTMMYLGLVRIFPFAIPAPFFSNAPLTVSQRRSSTSALASRPARSLGLPSS